MAKIGFKAGDIAFSADWTYNGWCTVLKIKGDKAMVKLEDYDGAIVNLHLTKLKQSADEDYNDWLRGLEEQRDLYPERPVEI